MVEWSIAAFGAAGSVRSIVVAVPPGHVHDLAGHDLGVVDGGATRARSVSNALEAVGTELVAIHDAARPLVTPGLIEDVIATLEEDPEAAGAIAAIPVTDTIKRVTQPEERRLSDLPTYRVVNSTVTVAETVDRGRLWAAQTPQVFRTEALREALVALGPDQIAAATDESMLVEAAGGTVLIHPSSAENVKVTTPLDLRLAEALLSERSAQ